MYHVRLPDGRLQTVEYVVDSRGYHANVLYDGGQVPAPTRFVHEEPPVPASVSPALLTPYTYHYPSAQPHYHPTYTIPEHQYVPLPSTVPYQLHPNSIQPASFVLPQARPSTKFYAIFVISFW